MNIDDLAEILVSSIEIQAMYTIETELAAAGIFLTQDQKDILNVGISSGIAETLKMLTNAGLIGKSA